MWEMCWRRCSLCFCAEIAGGARVRNMRQRCLHLAGRAAGAFGCGGLGCSRACSCECCFLHQWCWVSCASRRGCWTGGIRLICALTLLFSQQWSCGPVVLRAEPVGGWTLSDPAAHRALREKMWGRCWSSLGGRLHVVLLGGHQQKRDGMRPFACRHLDWSLFCVCLGEAALDVIWGVMEETGQIVLREFMENVGDEFRVATSTPPSVSTLCSSRAARRARAEGDLFWLWLF